MQKRVILGIMVLAMAADQRKEEYRSDGISE